MVFFKRLRYAIAEHFLDSPLTSTTFPGIVLPSFIYNEQRFKEALNFDLLYAVSNSHNETDVYVHIPFSDSDLIEKINDIPLVKSDHMNIGEYIIHETEGIGFRVGKIDRREDDVLVCMTADYRELPKPYREQVQIMFSSTGVRMDWLINKFEEQEYSFITIS